MVCRIAEGRLPSGRRRSEAVFEPVFFVPRRAVWAVSIFFPVAAVIAGHFRCHPAFGIGFTHDGVEASVHHRKRRATPGTPAAIESVHAIEKGHCGCCFGCYENTQSPASRRHCTLRDAGNRVRVFPYLQTVSPGEKQRSVGVAYGQHPAGLS